MQQSLINVHFRSNDLNFLLCIIKSTREKLYSNFVSMFYDVQKAFYEQMMEAEQ